MKKESTVRVGDLIKNQVLPAIRKGQLEGLSKTLNHKQEKLVKAFPEALEFANAMNFDVCISRYSNFKTIEDALFSDTLRIREITEVYGENATRGWIGAWLITVSDLMGFEISEQQRRFTATRLISVLYMINMVEWTMFFERLAAGNYGTFYGKFNPQTVIQGAITFRQQRGAAIARLSTEKRKEYESLITKK